MVTKNTLSRVNVTRRQKVSDTGHVSIALTLPVALSDALTRMALEKGTTRLDLIRKAVSEFVG